MTGQTPEPATTTPRLLFIHAHPDDESLATGVAMASHVRSGHDVHLLTCTLGEEGEVIPPTLAHLASDRDDVLGSWRRDELRAAMSELGVAHTVLGEDPESGVASRYRDSGMAGTRGATHPDAFVRADVGEAAALVAAHIRDLRPDVVVTYDRHGGYAHPDHIQTHRVTVAALASMVDPPVAYCILTPWSWAVQDRRWLREHAASISSNYVVLQQDAPYPPSVVSDEMVTHAVDEPGLVELQGRALARHRTQVSVHEGYYVLSNGIAARLSGREGFAQLDLATGDPVPAAAGVPGVPRHTGLLNDPRDPR